MDPRNPLGKSHSWRSARGVLPALAVVVLLSLIVLAVMALADPPATASVLTDVGGPITSSTTWDLAGSPYVVTSDVTVQNGAVLTIEPGVVGRMT